MIQNILVPVDLSESSLNALNTAVAIAKKHNASIQILHVEENAIDQVDETASFSSTSRLNASDIVTALASTISYSHNIPAGIIVEEGNVSDIIVNKSDKIHADLIVMGSHGASGYRDGFVGSNAYAVIKYATCPVLCIPVRKKVLSFKNLLFPIRPVSGGLVLYDFIRHFTDPNTTMEVLGLSYKNIEMDTGVLNTIVEEIKDQLKKDQVRTKVFWGEEGIITDDILQCAQQRNPDVLIVTPALDGASKPRFIGPYAQKVINCAKLPILYIKKVMVPMFV